ncbi:hypothetical protein BDFB_014296, partial [Asbolus verrucosus]
GSAVTPPPHDSPSGAPTRGPSQSVVPPPETAAPGPSTRSTATTTPPKGKVPPIVIRERARWTEVVKACANLKAPLKFNRAKPCVDGICIQPTSPEDYRALIKLLNSRQVQYHSFTLKEEKSIRVVLRQVPTEIKVEEVYNDLKAQGFDPIKNACTVLTDEDSGEENILSINNLPGSQLQAPAELTYNNDDNDYSSDDNIALTE